MTSSLCHLLMPPSVHRDAWVFGAVDPSSGTSAMLEVIRGFGGLLRRSWMPRRTIYICSWGGEEFGLIGSTAFAEANSDWISKKVLVYLNVDSGGSYRITLIILMVTWNRVVGHDTLKMLSIPIKSALFLNCRC